MFFFVNLFKLANKMLGCCCCCCCWNFVLDWYNAYFRVDFTFNAVANGTVVDADTVSTPVNGSFFLLEKFKVESAGKTL